MLAAANVDPVGEERAGRPQWRRAAGRPAQDRCDTAKYDKPRIECDAFSPYNHRGTVVVGCAWIAFYVIALFC
jgi:hypothetical protein